SGLLARFLPEITRELCSFPRVSQGNYAKNEDVMNLITIASALAFIAIGAIAGRYWSHKERHAGGPTPNPVPPEPVRDAGPEHMENPPKRWDNVDKQADESFPASDPPGNY